MFDDACLDGDAWVFGRAVISGTAAIGGHAQVFGDATVTAGAVISGHAWIHGHARITDEAWVHGRSQIGGNTLVCGTAVIDGALRIGGNAVIGDHADIRQSSDVEVRQLSWGDTITLYRCDDGAVGLGRSGTDHGPHTSRRSNLLDASTSRRIAELTDLWRVRDDPGGTVRA